jgi:hypothetical protein
MTAGLPRRADIPTVGLAGLNVSKNGHMRLGSIVEDPSLVGPLRDQAQF